MWWVGLLGRTLPKSFAEIDCRGTRGKTWLGPSPPQHPLLPTQSWSLRRTTRTDSAPYHIPERELRSLGHDVAINYNHRTAVIIQALPITTFKESTWRHIPDCLDYLSGWRTCTLLPPSPNLTPFSHRCDMTHLCSGALNQLYSFTEFA
jgi:hypothetical protein